MTMRPWSGKNEPCHTSKRQKLEEEHQEEDDLPFPFVVGDKFTPQIADIIFGYIDSGDFDTERRANLLKCRLVSKDWMDYIDKRTKLWSKKSISSKKYWVAKFAQFAKYRACIDNQTSLWGKEKNKLEDIPYPQVFQEKCFLEENCHYLQFPFVVGGQRSAHIADIIFGYIDSGDFNTERRANLLKCRLVSKEWMHYIDNQTSLWGKENISSKKYCQFAKYGAVDVCRHIIRNRTAEPSDKSKGETNPVVRYSIHVQTTPLHEAARNGHLEICKLIMETIDDKNPAIRKRRKDGWTPLHEAAENGHLEVCRLIFDNAEDKDPIYNKEGNSEGVTPIQLAALNGHPQVCFAVFDFRRRQTNDIFNLLPLSRKSNN